MTAWRQAFGFLGGSVALFAIARSSAVNVTWHAPNAAAVRLSWTARPERVETCRTLSEEELAEVPAHMRQRVVCEGTFANYDLAVHVDDEVLAREVVRGGGLRHDRPLHLLKSVQVDPGVRRVRIEFTRRERVDTTAALGAVRTEPDTGLFAGRAAREAEERRERARVAIAPVLALDTTVTIGAGSVLLVTYDGATRALVVMGAAR